MSFLTGIYLIQSSLTLTATADSINNELSLFVVLDSVERGSNVRELFEATEFHCLARQNFLDVLALVIDHKSDLAFAGPADKHVLLTECPLLH